MNTQVIVFSSLFLLSVILNIVFSALKKKLPVKIIFCTHIPLVSAAVLYILFSSLPDTDHVFLVNCISLGLLSICVILSVFEKKITFRLSVLFYYFSFATFLHFFYQIFFFVRPNNLIVLILIVVLIVLFVITEVISKEKSPKNWFRHLIFTLPSSLLLFEAAINEIYEVETWCILFLCGAFIIHLLNLFKIVNHRRNLKISSYILDDVFILGMTVVIISLIFFPSVVL